MIIIRAWIHDFFRGWKPCEHKFDKELSECLGIPEGKQEAEYEFLSGYLPPHGEVPVRYDAAHIFKLYNAGDGTSEFSSEIEIGLYEDGKFYK